MKTSKIILALFVVQILFLFIPNNAFGQTEKLGIVNYTPPLGMTKTAKVENVIAFSELDPKTGAYCIITMYGTTPSAGNPKSDFAREWSNSVVQTMTAVADTHHGCTRNRREI